MISLFSAFLHEGGHLILMYLFKKEPKKIVFGAFGIRIEESEKIISYKKEMLIALGGVAVNLILAFLGISVYYFTGRILWLFLAVVNLLIASLNLVPIKTLDMGRAVYFFLLRRYEEKALRISRIISLTFAVGVCIFTLIYSISFSFNISLFTVAVYLCFCTAQDLRM